MSYPEAQMTTQAQGTWLGRAVLADPATLSARERSRSGALTFTERVAPNSSYLLVNSCYGTASKGP